jgi:hypothetical protein
MGRDRKHPRHSRQVLGHRDVTRPCNLLTNHAAIVHRHGLLYLENVLEATHALPLFTASDLPAY